ncbi:hypothetical protein IV417_02815 [Alphaproteobacteria bacterium KMM 3653]|uniref:Uncharacterized protein n=1 Tax=Harenicola maris TaxID=2841044 RepID=A0AAP2G6Y5_9RHOB|nr:hypothetical protein [Harenicola maris]
MKNDEERFLGAVVASGLAGLLAAALSYVALGLGGIASVIIGIVVAAMIWFGLWYFWRNQDEMATKGAVVAPEPAPVSAATPVVTQATVTPVAAEAAAAEAAVDDAPVAPVIEPAPEPVAEPAPAPEPKAEVAEVAEGAGERPEALDGPRGGKADNLKEIKGVGPKMEELCNSLGFYHFDQIAGWSPQEVAWVDQNLTGFKGRVTRDDWVAQAQLLARGEATEFSKKVGKGGVY